MTYRSLPDSNLGPYLYLGPPNRNKSQLCINLPHRSCYLPDFFSHFRDSVWITSLLLTWICRSNTGKSWIVISRCPLLAGLVFWMLTVFCFGVLEHIWCHKGVFITPQKRHLILYPQISICIYFCTSIYPFTVHLFNQLAYFYWDFCSAGRQ